MKYSLVLALSVVFGLAQIAHAADSPFAKKKKKQKEDARAAQSVRAHTSVKSRNKLRAASFRPQAQPKLRKSQWQQQQAANHVNHAQVQNQNWKKQHNAVVSRQQTQQLANQRAARNENHGNRNHWRSSNLAFSEAYRRRHHHHDHHWWRSRYNNFVLFGRGYYYWDSGYWYPARGYNSAYNTYEYDGPIYGYDNLPPGQVVVNVQSVLQQRGYYRGAVDGSIGPLTRAALAAYQRDYNLEITAAIDGPTLNSLGMI